MKNLFKWERKGEFRGRESFTCEHKGMLCNLVKAKEDKYIFSIWDYGRVVTSRDYKESFSDLEYTKTFCENIMNEKAVQLSL